MTKAYGAPAARTALRFILAALAVAPAVYLLIAVQYSAITFPFWDHAELIRFLQAYYDGTLKLSDLWQPHNHSRPLMYRFVYVVNAVMTGWDIRSEYVFLLLSIYGAYAIHLWTLYKLDSRRSTMAFACCAVVLSLFFFSPVGHNNHWWSMMLQLNLSNLFIAYALLRVPFEADKWRTHAAAALACCLATYTLTNGLIAVLAIIIGLWLSMYPRLRPDRYIVFWLVFLAVLLAVYLPGLPSEPGERPSVFSLIAFCLVYLGAPLGGMLYFPYRGNFDIPQPLLLNGVCGAVLLACALWLLWAARDDMRRREPSAMILLLLFLFAAGSALATAWGRAAFDAYGVANANGSRYSIFASYLVFGIVYRVAQLLGRHATVGAGTPQPARGLGIAVMVTLIALSAVTYTRARHVYASAHDFNRQLGVAYQARGESAADKFVFPDPGFVARLKSALMRLELGPYRDIASRRVELIHEKRFVAPVPLSATARIVQRFKADDNGLKGIDIETVTHGMRHGNVDMAWTLYEVADGQPRLYAAGVVPAAKISDWKAVRLRVGPAWESAGKEYELALETTQPNSGNTGVPTYEASRPENRMRLVGAGGSSRPGPGTLNLSLIYVD